MFFEKIYNNLCEKNKIKQDAISLHCHHILPRHSGGLDIEENYTYLTPREHQIAHYLLWKINGNVNDLRSMKMLSARMTIRQRKIIGEYCRDNQIGFFHPKFHKDRGKWGLKGIETQIRNKIGIHNPDNFSKYASIGGKVGSRVQMQNKIGIFGMSKEEHKKNSSLGGKITGYYSYMTDTENNKRKVPKDQVQDRLLDGWKEGWYNKSKDIFLRKTVYAYCTITNKNKKIPPQQLEQFLIDNPSYIKGRYTKPKVKH